MRNVNLIVNRSGFNAKLKVCSRAITIALTLVVAAMQAQAQADIHYSQFYESCILRNPALTGVFADDYKAGVYYRNQWNSISAPYETIRVSAVLRTSISAKSEDFISFGILGYSDKAGSIDQSIFGFYPTINYNKAINPEHNTFLSVGFTGGYIQYSFDPSKATFDNQYQPGGFSVNNPSLESFPNTKMNFWDVGAGINFNTSTGEYNNITYIIGVAGYHFTTPNMSYFKDASVNMDMRWNGNGAVAFSVSDQVTVQAQANYAKQGTYHEIIGGGLVNWNPAFLGDKPNFILTGGLMYRYDDAIIPIIKIRNGGLALGVSYDVNVSTLKEASNLAGGIEITLFYSDQNARNKTGVLSKTICPRF
jgi:type IX secretion system PorP/SprF family membrane protein